MTQDLSVSDLLAANGADAHGWQSCGAMHVAVYGTLRSGGSNDMGVLRPGITAVGRTTLQGSLYDLGWYPGLVLEGTQQVVAEVYPMDPRLELLLDRIEGLWPRDVGEYAKRLLDVQVAHPDGRSTTMRVLVYEALPEAVENAPLIAASDWLAWFMGKGLQHPDAVAQRKANQNKK